MNIIIDNIKNGIVNLYEKSGDASCGGDIELAAEYWKAAEILEDVYFGYIPCFAEEL